MKRPVVLTILDGFGISHEIEGNAISGNIPNITEITKNSQYTELSAAGMSVGLPDGQMGNSEVGHTNIGAGRIVYQELTRISKSIKDGDFFTNKTLLNAIENCKQNDSALHLIGLLSDGGVHSHNTHLYALLELASQHNLKKVYVHALMDGRDVSPTSGINFILELQQKIKEIGTGEIASIIGRYFAMDRDNRWERVEKAYNALVFGKGQISNNPVEVMENTYNQGITDEFIEPTICSENSRIKKGDSVIFTNFRPDRAREITRTIVDQDFNGFSREYFSTFYVCMTQYDSSMPNVTVAYTPTSLDNTLGEYLSKMGKTQLRIAETEKYAHVTFFFNGGKEKAYEGEDRVLIPSPKVATYDLKPEMSAYEVCEEVVAKIESGKYDCIILNYANCDMVGHTGIISAAQKAVQVVDECVKKTYDAVMKADGVMIITADHGNADKMLEDDGVSPFTAHTTNRVPFIVSNYDCKLREDGVLSDIAPTILKIMQLPQPVEMDAQSIIK